MDDGNTQPETALDQDEAIREEIRALLRGASTEPAAPKRRLVDVRPQDIAALRLISGCG